MPNEIWIDIDDDRVRNVWFAPQDNDEQAVLHPNWYEENGTPISTDGEDMVYSHTEMLMHPGDPVKLALINAMFNEHQMFHTPKSKEEASAWCELQGHQMTIGFMVGLNYAAEMIKQVMKGTHPALTPTYDPDAEVPIPAHDATPKAGGDDAEG